MTSFSVKDLLTPAQAAKIMKREVNGVPVVGVTRQWVFDLMNRGQLPVVVIAGKRFLRRQDVLNYRGVPGRPPSRKSKRRSGADLPLRSLPGAKDVKQEAAVKSKHQQEPDKDQSSQ